MRTNWRWLSPVRVTVINWFWINQLINRPELLHLRVTEYASNPSIIFMSHNWKYTRWGLFLGPFEVVFNPLWGYCWKGNFLTNRSVRLSCRLDSWLVGRSVCHDFQKGQFPSRSYQLVTDFWRALSYLSGRFQCQQTAKSVTGSISILSNLCKWLILKNKTENGTKEGKTNYINRLRLFNWNKIPKHFLNSCTNNANKENYNFFSLHLNFEFPSHISAAVRNNCNVEIKNIT